MRVITGVFVSVAVAALVLLVLATPLATIGMLRTLFGRRIPWTPQAYLAAMWLNAMVAAVGAGGRVARRG